MAITVRKIKHGEDKLDHPSHFHRPARQHHRPSPMVNHTSTASTPYITSATGYRRSRSDPVLQPFSLRSPLLLPCSAASASPNLTHQNSVPCSLVPCSLNSWCTGEDSNLRNSNEWQIYSLLPLTARPPVHRPSHNVLLPGAQTSHLATRRPFPRTSIPPDHSGSPGPEARLRCMHLEWDHRRDRPDAYRSSIGKTCVPLAPSFS